MSKKAPVPKVPARAPPPSPRAPAAPRYTIEAFPIARAILLVLVAAAASHVSQISLAPVYGDIPSSLYHDQLTTYIFLGVWAVKSIAHLSWSPFRGSFLIPAILLLAPAILLNAFPFSTQLGPINGPIVTEALTYYPLVLLASASAASLTAPSNILHDVLPMGVSFIIFSYAKSELPKLIFPYIGTHAALTRCGLYHVLGAASAIASPSLALLGTLPAIYHSYTHNPLCVDTPALNLTLNAYNHSLIARQESNTGYISILDNFDIGYRVMRCDHSLLGGEWQSPPKGLEEHDRPGFKEPIYAIFVIMEAVRLVVPAPKNPQPTALAIGLGIGTSADAMIKHGVKTDIVELDPVVYRYALDYFNLDPDHTAYLEDAVGFVDRESTRVENRKQYDYIIHDVFTGGAVPASLFTKEIFEGLKTLLAPDGLIAINWAGDLKLKAARSIIQTVRSVFSNCKGYREEEAQEGGDSHGADFTNMVLFCTPLSTTKWSFRYPVEEDYLNSFARRNYLFPRFEIDFEKYWGSEAQAEPASTEPETAQEMAVLTRSNIALLKEWQKQSAVGHWRVIRDVVPGRVWEMY